MVFVYQHLSLKTPNLVQINFLVDIRLSLLKFILFALFVHEIFTSQFFLQPAKKNKKEKQEMSDGPPKKKKKGEEEEEVWKW